nr:uncharacterized protein LOC133624531 isoform X3 [Nerophis lumbriciformis]
MQHWALRRREFGRHLEPVVLLLFEQQKEQGRTRRTVGNRSRGITFHNWARSLIHANHTSAVGQVGSVNFTLSSTAVGLGCRVDGASMSAFWSSLFDNGTNYCNLRNIIQAILCKNVEKKSTSQPKDNRYLPCIQPNTLSRWS